MLLCQGGKPVSVGLLVSRVNEVRVEGKRHSSRCTQVSQEAASGSMSTAAWRKVLPPLDTTKRLLCVSVPLSSFSWLRNGAFPNYQSPTRTEGGLFSLKYTWGQRGHGGSQGGEAAAAGFAQVGP